MRLIDAPAVDEKKRPFALQIDIATFERMERLIEDYAWGKLIYENNSPDGMTLIAKQSQTPEKK